MATLRVQDATSATLLTTYLVSSATDTDTPMTTATTFMDVGLGCYNALEQSFHFDFEVICLQQNDW